MTWLLRSDITRSLALHEAHAVLRPDRCTEFMKYRMFSRRQLGDSLDIIFFSTNRSPYCHVISYEKINIRHFVSF